MSRTLKSTLSSDRNLGTWKGGLFEHIVGEALVKAGVPLAYYKRENSTLEMDFFARSADCLVPIEGVKLVNGNVGYENGVLTLPQWCAFRLPEIIRAKVD